MTDRLMIFPTRQAAEAALSRINSELGYPDSKGTDTDGYVREHPTNGTFALVVTSNAFGRLAGDDVPPWSKAPLTKAIRDGAVRPHSAEWDEFHQQGIV